MACAEVDAVAAAVAAARAWDEEAEKADEADAKLDVLKRLLSRARPTAKPEHRLDDPNGPLLVLPEEVDALESRIRVREWADPAKRVAAGKPTAATLAETRLVAAGAAILEGTGAGAGAGAAAEKEKEKEKKRGSRKKGGASRSPRPPAPGGCARRPRKDFGAAAAGAFARERRRGGVGAGVLRPGGAAAGALPPLEDVERLVKEEAGIPATLEGSAELARPEARRCGEGAGLPQGKAHAPRRQRAVARAGARRAPGAGRRQVLGGGEGWRRSRSAWRRPRRGASAPTPPWRRGASPARRPASRSSWRTRPLRAGAPAAVDVRACAAALRVGTRGAGRVAFRRDGEDGDELAAGKRKRRKRKRKRKRGARLGRATTRSRPMSRAGGSADARLGAGRGYPGGDGAAFSGGGDATPGRVRRVDRARRRDFAESGESSRGAPERERESARVGSAALGASTREEAGQSGRARAGRSEPGRSAAP